MTHHALSSGHTYPTQDDQRRPRMIMFRKKVGLR